MGSLLSSEILIRKIYNFSVLKKILFFFTTQFKEIIREILKNFEEIVWFSKELYNLYSFGGVKTRILERISNCNQEIII